MLARAFGLFVSLLGTSLCLTWEVEAAVPMAFGRGVGWRRGTRRVTLLEGRRGGGRR